MYTAVLLSVFGVCRAFNYPAAYVFLVGERGEFSLLDVDQQDSTAFFALHPKQRQVCFDTGNAQQVSHPPAPTTAA